MKDIDVFTSTGIKLIHHPEVLHDVKCNKKARPMSLQIAPTSRCQLNCNFCSNIKRNKHEDIDKVKLFNFIKQLKMKGLKTVEWTGGGDPSMYDSLSDLILACHAIELEQGMITNGLGFSRLSPVALSCLKWIRISMNGIDYGRIPQKPCDSFKGTLGFSYVWNDRTGPEEIEFLKKSVAFLNPTYVRIVPNCLATHEQQEKNNIEIAAKVAEMGPPFFYQAKHFKTPSKCYWGLFKPFLLHDGYVYPCSSVVLNMEADRQFHEKYRIGQMETFPEIYKNDIQFYETTNCSHCVFHNQNMLIEDLLHPNGMQNFV